MKSTNMDDARVTSATMSSGAVTSTGGGHADPVGNVMHGRLDDLPPLPSNVVQIYISSNFSDFSIERDCLWREVLPDLQVHFLPQGMDIQLVDIHQGCVTDHALDAHRFQGHLQELKNCYDKSMGAFFVGLLGNKYGTVPLPMFLEKAEFEHIRNEIFETGKDVKLLDEWYVCDDNAVPQVFALKPITTKFPLYDQRGEREADGGVDEERVGWRKTHEQLQQLLQQSATACYQEGVINQVHGYKQRRFFTAGVEQEILAALECSPKNCIIFNRILEGVNMDSQDVAMYTDTDATGARDRDAQRRLQGLRDMLATRLNDDSKHIYQMKWSDNGLLPSGNLEHAKYLDNFQLVITTHIISLVENAIQNSTVLKNCREEKKALYREVLPHLHHCRKLIANDRLLVFEALSERMGAALIRGCQEDHPACLICGSEGQGKTYTASYIAKKALAILGKETSLFIRYIGLTSGVTSLFELLRGLCMQINYALKQEASVPGFTRLDRLVSYYHGLLNVFSTTANNLVIVIDGVDNIKAIHEGVDGKLDWMSSTLPPKVHLILTVSNSSSSSFSFFKKQKSKSSQSAMLFELPVLTDTQFHLMMTKTLKTHKRTISADQRVFISKIFSKTQVPLVGEFLLDVALRATSRDDLCLGKLPQRLEDVIEGRFEAIERKHGADVVGHIGRYLSCGHKGLSECELLDVLSCHNELLVDVLHSNQLQQHLRFPVSLWIDIKHMLGNLVVFTYIDKKTLINFSHKCVGRVAASRYRVCNETMKRSHRDIADLYLDTWVAYKPMVLPEKAITMIDTGCRHVCQQPFLYSETTYNLRRLNELWYQLLRAGEIDMFKEYTFCNFEYLLAKLHSTSIQSLIADLETTSIHVMDAELHLVLLSIVQSKAVLSRDPLQLASELIGRLRQIKDQYPGHVASLIQQAMEWCDSHTLPILVPLSSWLPDPRSPLVTFIDIPEGVHDICLTRNGQHVFCSTLRNDIRMYHTPSKTLIRTLSGHRGQVTCLEMSHDNTFLVTGSTDSTVRLWDVGSGMNRNMFRVHNDAVLCMTLNKSDELLVTGSKDKSFKVMSLSTGDVLHSVREHDAPVNNILLSSTDAILISASLDKCIKVWCMEDLTILNTITDDIPSPILSLALSVDNTFLLVGCSDSTLQVRSFTTGSKIHELQGHCGNAESVGIAGDCFHCAVGSSDSNVYVYNLRTTELLQVLKGHDGPVSSLRISRDGYFIYSSAKNQIRVWPFVKRFTHNVFIDTHSAEITCMAISGDGKICVTGSKDKLLKTWNLEISDFIENLEGHEGAITCVAIAPDEAFIVSGSDDCLVRVWSVVLGCVITDYKDHTSPIRSVFPCHHSSGHRVMSAETEGFIHIWQAENGESILKLMGPVDILQLSPNSQIGISGNSGEISVKLWRASDGDLIETVSHTDIVTCICFSADSQYVGTGSADMSLKLWESLTGKLTQVLVEHESDVTCMAITEGNRYILSGSKDQRLLVWSLSTGTVERQLIGHSAPVTCVKVTIDGTVAISGSLDGTLRVWNINHGICITTFDMHSPVKNLLSTHDAGHVVVNISDNKLPLLCLHNSPAGDVKSQSQISIQLGDSPVLPLRPRPFLSQSCSGLPRLKATDIRRFSVSTIPEIIKVSPMRAPLKTAVLAQEHNKETREQKASKRKSGKKEKKGEEKQNSKMCVVL